MIRNTASRVGRWLVALLSIAAIGQFGFILYDRIEATPDPTVPFALGDTVPGFELRALSSGVRHTLSSLRSPCALVVFYSSSCPACERRVPEWRAKKRLAVAGTDVPVYWVTSHKDRGGAEWAHRNELNGFAVKHKTLTRAARVEYVPQYMLLGPRNELLLYGVVLPGTPQLLADTIVPQVVEQCSRS